MSATINPYLTFNGNAAETMKFYHSILGGKLNMQTFDEAKMAKTPAEKDRIIHATLETDAITLMAGDAMINQSVKFGDNVSLSISGQDKDKLARIFDRLANGLATPTSRCISTLDRSSKGPSSGSPIASANQGQDGALTCLNDRRERYGPSEGVVRRRRRIL